jgi:hypothetical protein
LAKEKHEALYPGYKYRPKRNAKGSGKSATRSSGGKRKKVEEELPIESEIVESPSAKSDEKDTEFAKPPIDSGNFHN